MEFQTLFCYCVITLTDTLETIKPKSQMLSKLIDKFHTFKIDINCNFLATINIINNLKSDKN